jgi:hypothetical protein
MSLIEGSGVWEFFLYGTMLVALIFSRFEKKIVKDEREEMIRLKALEVTSDIQGWTMFGLIVYMDLLNRSMSSKKLLVIMVILAFYVEIAGKLYFRRKY